MRRLDGRVRGNGFHAGRTFRNTSVHAAVSNGYSSRVKAESRIQMASSTGAGPVGLPPPRQPGKRAEKNEEGRRDEPGPPARRKRLRTLGHIWNCTSPRRPRQRGLPSAGPAAGPAQAGAGPDGRAGRQGRSSSKPSGLDQPCGCVRAAFRPKRSVSRQDARPKPFPPATSLVVRRAVLRASPSRFRVFLPPPVAMLTVAHRAPFSFIIGNPRCL